MWIVDKIRQLLGIKRKPQILYVNTQEQADAINGIMGMEGETLLKVSKIAEPSYGRLVTFEYDLSTPEGIMAFEWMKVISQFNGNNYADLRIGENTITFDFANYQDAEELRDTWLYWDRIRKEATGGDES